MYFMIRIHSYSYNIHMTGVVCAKRRKRVVAFISSKKRRQYIPLAIKYCSSSSSSRGPHCPFTAMMSYDDASHHKSKILCVYREKERDDDRAKTYSTAIIHDRDVRYRISLLANSCPSFIPGRLKRRRKRFLWFLFTERKEEKWYKKIERKKKNVCPYSFMNAAMSGRDFEFSHHIWWQTSVSLLSSVLYIYVSVCCRQNGRPKCKGISTFNFLFSFCDHHQQRQVENFPTPLPPARHQLVAMVLRLLHTDIRLYIFGWQHLLGERTRLNEDRLARICNTKPTRDRTHTLCWLFQLAKLLPLLSFSFRGGAGNASCHLMRPGQMNQDYVRPKKSVHSLHHACRPEEPPPPLTVQQQEGGSQSTRWSLTVRYFNSNRKRGNTAERERSYIYIRPISSRPLSIPTLIFIYY